MKSPENPPKEKKRPYDAPMLTRQSNLKSITLFTNFDGGRDGGGNTGGEPHHRDDG